MNPLRTLEGLPPVKALGIRALKLHQEIYVRSGGRIGHRLGPTRNLILRTTGAKSGAPRVNALTYARDADRYVIVASFGGAPRSPAWFHNLRAHPDVEAQIGTRRIRVHADVVAADDPDRARLWRLANEHNGGRYDDYQRLTERVIHVVVLTPR